MKSTSVQTLFDKLAISVSLLCVLHCLLTPILLIAVPVFSSTLLAGEAFHQFLVFLVLPLSAAAILLGCRHHKDFWVLGISVLGLSLLTFTAFFGHDTFGEAGEKWMTVLSGLVLSTAHLRNFKLCRREHCSC